MTGSAGSTHTNVATVTGHDDDEQSLTAHDDATVTITPAPVVPKLIDLYVTKTDLPDPVELNGQLTYTIVGQPRAGCSHSSHAGRSAPRRHELRSGVDHPGELHRRVGNQLRSRHRARRVDRDHHARRDGTAERRADEHGDGGRQGAESNTANNTATATTLVPAPLVRQPRGRVRPGHDHAEVAASREAGYDRGRHCAATRSRGGKWS